MNAARRRVHRGSGRNENVPVRRVIYHENNDDDDIDENDQDVDARSDEDDRFYDGDFSSN